MRRMQVWHDTQPRARIKTHRVVTFSEGIGSLLWRESVEEIQHLIDRATAARAAQAEKHRAFGEIVRRFQDLAFGCAYAILGDFQLAEDAAQEAFLTAWRNLDQLRKAEAFPGWL